MKNEENMFKFKKNFHFHFRLEKMNLETIILCLLVAMLCAIGLEYGIKNKLIMFLKRRDLHKVHVSHFSKNIVLQILLNRQTMLQQKTKSLHAKNAVSP